MPNSLTQTPEFWVGDGLLIHNPLYPEQVGTLSGLVCLKGQYYGLCCCHVAQPNNFQEWPQNAAITIVEKGTGAVVGTIAPEHAFTTWDVALIHLQEADKWRVLFPKKMTLIADSRTYVGQMFVFSDLIKTQKNSSGVLYEHRLSSILKQNLPLLAQKNKQGRWQDVSTEGNSGAIVFHEKEQRILGLVAAGFIRGTYITKLDFLIQ